MVLDLRILFLFFLFVTAVIFTLRKGPALAPEDIRTIFLDFLLVPMALGTVATFGFLLTRTDPLPLIREAAYQMSLQHLVSFADAIPERLEDNIHVENVGRYDTDGDGFNEWVVFYTFDTPSGNNPLRGVVYDNDRGNPPVIFPYELRAPGRDYLAENLRALDLDLEAITTDQNGPNQEDLDEILISDDNQLTIFRFNQNSEAWDFPRDAPPRYQPIGFFRGNGGVSFDEATHNVTVIDRDKFERSQLVIRSIYGVNPVSNSYWDDFDSTTLAAPVVSTVDFFSGPPTDIVNTPFPEKLVLAFYASTCGSEDDTLCRNFDAGWEPQQFLTGEALIEYQNRNPIYFGLANFDNVQNISISHLRYYPRLETDPDLLPTGTGRDVVTGEQPQFNLVDINFVAGGGPIESARYEMQAVEGQWKIARRVPLDSLALDSPTQIPASQ